MPFCEGNITGCRIEVRSICRGRQSSWLLIVDISASNLHTTMARNQKGLVKKELRSFLGAVNLLGNKGFASGYVWEELLPKWEIQFASDKCKFALKSCSAEGSLHWPDKSILLFSVLNTLDIFFPSPLEIATVSGVAAGCGFV